MSSNEYALSLKTNRLVKKSTANYRKLKKLNLIKELDAVEPVPAETPPPSPEPVEPVEPEPVEPEFSERDLQHKMAELTTNMVADNVKKIVKSQKLSNEEYDALLRRMLYKKLCIDPEPTKIKTKKGKKAKKKFKIVEPSESSDSDSE